MTEANELDAWWQGETAGAWSRREVDLCVGGRWRAAGTRLHVRHGGFGKNTAVRDEYRNRWPGVMALLTAYLGK
ncbi:MAG: hypothetical protein ACOY71_03330 [Gemmatimonadota bacterium]